MSNTDIANTIRTQIGGRALFMIGAKNLTAHDKGLSFKVGRNAKGVTHVKVTLTPLDLYDVTFLRVWGTKRTLKASVEGIYVDMLHTTIETHTGLYTSL